MYPQAYNPHTAKLNKNHSSNSLITPRVTTGAGFGSFGIRNIPHKIAAITGIARAKIYLVQFSVICKPQYASAISITISKKNRKPKFSG